MSPELRRGPERRIAGHLWPEHVILARGRVNAALWRALARRTEHLLCRAGSEMLEREIPVCHAFAIKKPRPEFLRLLLRPLGTSRPLTSKRSMSTTEPNWLKWARELQAITQTGLTSPTTLMIASVTKRCARSPSKFSRRKATRRRARAFRGGRPPSPASRVAQVAAGAPAFGAEWTAGADSGGWADSSDGGRDA